MSAPHSEIWSGEYKIPWHDPGFSSRMLAEHLSQEHDLASRRTEWIDRQVGWIHAALLGGQPARILDLGCGPGLYLHRLARRGHHCHGIDFGPASIEYARQHNPDASLCEFMLADVRRADFGPACDLIMLLYGELNVFSPPEASAILRKARASLVPRGRLIVEVQTPQAVEKSGRAEPTEQEHDSGLFSDGPHRCHTRNQWLPDHRVAVQTFTVNEASTGQTRVYRSTTQAWSDAELTRLLTDAGLRDVSPSADWPCNTDGLVLWVATRA